MRQTLSVVVVGLFLIACKAGVGSGGVTVKEQPPTADVKAKGTADAKSGGAAASNEPAPPGMTEAEAEAVCTAIRTPDCDQMEKCAPKTLTASYGDKATCVKRQVAECKAAFMLPGTKISLDQGKACGAKVAARGCDATDEIAECTFRGTIADGGPCFSRDECQSAYCEGGSVAKCGKCKPKPAVNKGAADGAACKAETDCNKWALCEGGKCVPAGKKKGAKCNQNDSCLFRLGLGCQFGTCVEVASIAETGAACKADSAAKTVPMCKLGRCDQSSNKCVALKPEGEACKEGDCMTDLICDAKTKKCGPPQIDTGACWKK